MSEPTFHKNHPFLAKIKERYSLSKPGSQKQTQHLVLDLHGSGLNYAVGDSIGVYPQHDPRVIKNTLHAIRASGEERVVVPATGETLSLHDFLAAKGNITHVSPKLFREVAARQINHDKKSYLEDLQQESNREAFKAFTANREVWDFLLENEEVTFTPQEFVALLMPLLPRFYSIASSQKHVGDEAHVTVAPLEYESNGHKRYGVCTHFLCHLADLHRAEVPVFIQPSHGFNLPQDPHLPLIMVGPGTGVAPFRGFMQERLFHHRSKGKHWLFFGERNRAHDFLYEEDWDAFSQQGHLRLDVAFSRDQEQKLYVQHKMMESGQELYEWLQEGAHLFVCGDAKRMARDVEQTLQTIIQEYGSKDPQAAKDYIKQLRQQKRYLRDVY